MRESEKGRGVKKGRLSHFMRFRGHRQNPTVTVGQGTAIPHPATAAAFPSVARGVRLGLDSGETPGDSHNKTKGRPGVVHNGGHVIMAVNPFKLIVG